MKLIGENFSRNGHKTFTGIVKAVEDDGVFTGWADAVNIYSRREVLKLIDNLTDDLFVSLDRARAMVFELCKKLEECAQSAEAQSAEYHGDGKKSQGTILLELAEECVLWHTPDQRPFVTIEVESHHENWAINSRPFRQWLSYRFYQVERKSPGTQAVYDAVSVLTGKAIFEGPEFATHVRVAEAEDAIYIDLGDGAWDAIKVTAGGWKIVNDPPVRFRRPRGMLPLPTPKEGGDVNRLRLC